MWFCWCVSSSSSLSLLFVVPDQFDLQAYAQPGQPVAQATYVGGQPQYVQQTVHTTHVVVGAAPMTSLM